MFASATKSWPLTITCALLILHFPSCQAQSIQNQVGRTRHASRQTVSVNSTALCPDVPHFPPDISNYNKTEWKGKEGSTYKVINTTGLYQNPKSSHSLGGVVFGQPGTNANSWDYCVESCGTWCDEHENCHSFNVFSFQESDYENCQVTCQCRAVNREFQKSDYYVGDDSFPSSVFYQDKHWFNATCSYDPAAWAFDPCLWDAANITGWIKDFYGNYPQKGGNGLISDIIHNVFGNETYTCDISSIAGCPLSGINTPPWNAPEEEIKAHLAFTALRRYMMYVAANRYVTDEAFIDFISVHVPAILDDFTGNGTKPSASDESWSLITSGISVLASIAALIAAPEAGVSAIVWWDISTMLGLGGTIGGIVEAVQPGGLVAAGIKDFPQYMSASAQNLTRLYDLRAEAFVNNATYAATLLNSTVRGAALNLTTDAAWKDPIPQVKKMEKFLNSWTISQVFKMLGLFVHMESDGNSTAFYNGEQRFVPDGYDTRQYAFPVYYVMNQTPRLTRIYNDADNLINYGIGWTDVYKQSTHCQYSVNKFISFGDHPYPDMPYQDLADKLREHPDLDPNSIDCFWNLPVCESSAVIKRECTDSQSCCTGHASDAETADQANLGWEYPVDLYDADNFGLDDWCARKLGVKGLEGSQYWKYTNPPFKHC